VRADRKRRVILERVNGESVFGSRVERLLVAEGFRAGLRGLELRGEDAPRAS
jgi:hypothetical protein